jgi:hypothetical protein
MLSRCTLSGSSASRSCPARPPRRSCAARSGSRACGCSASGRPSAARRTGGCGRPAWRRCRRRRTPRRRGQGSRSVSAVSVAVVADVAGPAQLQATRGEQLDDLGQVLVLAFAGEDLVANDDQAEVHRPSEAAARAASEPGPATDSSVRLPPDGRRRRCRPRDSLQRQCQRVVREPGAENAKTRCRARWREPAPGRAQRSMAVTR